MHCTVTWHDAATAAADWLLAAVSPFCTALCWLRSYLVAVGGRSLYVAFMGTKQVGRETSRATNLQ